MRKIYALFALPVLIFVFAVPAYAQQGSIMVGENLLVKPAYILAGMFIGAVVAVLSVFYMKNKLRSVSFKKEADSYIKSGSFLLTESKDIFIDKKTDRSLRTKNSGIIDELRNN